MQVLTSTFLFIVLSEFSVCFANNWSKCKRGERCIPIQECAPKMVDQTGDQCAPGVGKKATICERSNTVLKMCCAAPTTPPSTHLPLECGRQPVPHRGIRTNSAPPFGSHPWIGAQKVNRSSGTYIRFYLVIFISSTFVIDVTNEWYIPKDPIIRYGLSHYGADQKQQCVVLGEEKQCYERREAGIKERFDHPDDSSIRLLQLNRTVDFKDRSALVEPICLPTKDQSPPLEGHEALLVAMNVVLGQLMSTVVFVVDLKDCKKRARLGSERYWENTICARRIGPLPSLRGGFWASFLLVWDESEPPIFTLVGVEKHKSRLGDLFVFHSVKGYLLPWIQNVISGTYSWSKHLGYDKDLNGVPFH